MVNGKALTFDVWRLDRDVFLMRDRDTDTTWAHLDGKASQGPLAGSRLTMLPMTMTTWGEWQAAYPQTTVLSRDTAFADRYRPVSLATYNPSEARFGDDRLPSNALVVGVEVADAFKGYAIDVLTSQNGVANDTLSGKPVLVIYDPIGRTGIAYERTVNGMTLEFENADPGGFELRDRQTGTRWNAQGQALEGPLEGTRLTFVPSFISEWYGWSAYHPGTALYYPGS